MQGISDWTIFWPHFFFFTFISAFFHFCEKCEKIKISVKNINMLTATYTSQIKFTGNWKLRSLKWVVEEHSGIIISILFLKWIERLKVWIIETKFQNSNPSWGAQTSILKKFSLEADVHRAPQFIIFGKFLD